MANANINALSFGEKNARVENLILEMANGRTTAIDTLYSLIKTDVFAFALSKTRNKGDAEDIMQDVFIQIYKNARLYRPQGKPMAWIYTITHNLIKRLFSIQNRTVTLEDGVEYLDERSVEDDAINNRFLQSIMSNLDQDQTEIIVMHVVSGFKFREIAKLLNKPLSTVLSIYNRSIKKLRKLQE